MLALRPTLPGSGQPTRVEPDVTDGVSWLNRSQPAIYRIVVQGELTADWSNWFSDGRRVWSTVITVEHGTTTVTGIVADQPALYGLLAKVRDLGLPLMSVTQVRNESASD
jgi:hypothetical protein